MSKGYRILASTGIHKGDRDYQQDQVELMQHTRIPNCLLAVLADGMGGRSGGRKASDQVMLSRWPDARSRVPCGENWVRDRAR